MVFCSSLPPYTLVVLVVWEFYWVKVQSLVWHRIFRLHREPEWCENNMKTSIPVYAKWSVHTILGVHTTAAGDCARRRLAGLHFLV